MASSSLIYFYLEMEIIRVRRKQTSRLLRILYHRNGLTALIENAIRWLTYLTYPIIFTSPGIRRISQSCRKTRKRRWARTHSESYLWWFCYRAFPWKWWLANGKNLAREQLQREMSAQIEMSTSNAKPWHYPILCVEATYDLSTGPQYQADETNHVPESCKLSLTMVESTALFSQKWSCISRSRSPGAGRCLQSWSTFSAFIKSTPTIGKLFAAVAKKIVFRLILNNLKKRQRSFLNLAWHMAAITIQATGKCFRGYTIQHTIYSPLHCSTSVVMLMMLWHTKQIIK